MLSAILGRKVGMTQIFGPNGAAVPATVIEAGPCTITQVKTVPNDGYEAVQIGYGALPPARAKRPLLGHLGHALTPTPSQRKRQQQTQARERQKAREAAAKAEQPDATASEAEADEAASRGESGGKASRRSAGTRKRRGSGAALGPFKLLREVRVIDGSAVRLGETIDVGMFRIGEEVDIIGTSKGKGFAGVMKRHGFRGGPRTHGQSDRARAPGSIGPGTTPGRVLKGTRMAGHMGHARVTVKHLEVLQADAARNLLVLKGSVPGPNGGTVMIRKVAGQTQLLAHLRTDQTSSSADKVG
jgi:large subunit ribosomal protein L3